MFSRNSTILEHFYYKKKTLERDRFTSIEKTFCLLPNQSTIDLEREAKDVFYSSPLLIS